MVVLNPIGSLSFSTIRNSINLSGKVSISTFNNNNNNLNNYFKNFRIGTLYIPKIIENNVLLTPTLISGTTYYYTFTNISGTNSIQFGRNYINCDLFAIGGGGYGADIYLLYGGGAGPDYYCGGGGAGGRYQYITNYKDFVSGYIYNVIVGKGGTITTLTTNYNTTTTPTDSYIYNTPNGQNAVLGRYALNIAKQSSAVIHGGYNTFANRATGSSTFNISGFGNLFANGAGGEGAGGKGENGTTSKPGNGGIGISNSITGTLKYYGAGGGGSGYLNDYYTYSISIGTKSTSEYGTGGNGGFAAINNNLKAENGTSGCVIVRFTL